MRESEGDEGVRLMLAYQGGDEAAFDRLVELYAPKVWALLTRFLGPSPSREDLVQDVFLRVVRARDRYEPTARFSTFLYTIAYRLAANERARADLRHTEPLGGQSGEDDAVDPNEPTPERALMRRGEVELVRAAIAALPEQQRMALILARYEELPYAQIAEVLGSSEKAIKSLIHRARENLRTHLAPLLQEDFA